MFDWRLFFKKHTLSESEQHTLKIYERFLMFAETRALNIPQWVGYFWNVFWFVFARLTYQPTLQNIMKKKKNWNTLTKSYA